MSRITAERRKDMPDLKATREAWVAEVEKVFQDAEEWSAQEGWGTLRDMKMIKEEGVESYELPRMLIHGLEGRVLLEPLERDPIDGEGRFEICVIPSYDSTPIVKVGDRWRFFDRSRGRLGPVWSRKSLVKVRKQLFDSQ
jgi:hypothetical protein